MGGVLHDRYCRSVGRYHGSKQRQRHLLTTAKATELFCSAALTVAKTENFRKGEITQ